MPAIRRADCPTACASGGPTGACRRRRYLFISVYDVPGDDHIYVTAQHDPLPGVSSGLMEILFASAADVFSGSDLPLTPPDLASFSTRRITLDGVSTNSAEGVAIVGELTSFQAVPEPATLSLLGVGVAALVARRRAARG